MMPLLAEDRSIRDAVYISGAFRTDSWKAFQRSDELYNVAEDPRERINQFGERTDIARTLRRRHDLMRQDDMRLFHQFLQRSGSSRKEVELTKEEAERLRALGYLN